MCGQNVHDFFGKKFHTTRFLDFLSSRVIRLALTRQIKKKRSAAGDTVDLAFTLHLTTTCMFSSSLRARQP